MRRSGKYELAAFVAGIVLTIVVFAVGMSYAPTSLFRQAVVALDACEASLPRDQHCVVTAVVASPE